MGKIIVSPNFNPDADLVLFQGDTLELLKQIPDEFVKLVVTSPPYNIGKPYETKLDLNAYLDQQKIIIQECVRILKRDGSICWQVGNYVNNGSIPGIQVPTPGRSVHYASRSHPGGSQVQPGSHILFGSGAHPGRQQIPGELASRSAGHRSALLYRGWFAPYTNVVKMPARGPAVLHVQTVWSRSHPRQHPVQQLSVLLQNERSTR